MNLSTNKIVRSIQIGAFFGVSVGWLFPLAIAAYLFCAWAEEDVQPVVFGRVLLPGSFPKLHFAQQSFWIGFFWFAIVVFAWVAYFAHRAMKQLDTLRPNDEAKKV